MEALLYLLAVGREVRPVLGHHGLQLGGGGDSQQDLPELEMEYLIQ